MCLSLRFRSHLALLVCCEAPACLILWVLPLCCRNEILWNHFANYYSIISSLNLQSPDAFFRGSDGPHCEALLSCCHSLSSSPWHGEQYRAVQPCHAWLQVLFFFLRDHFSFLVHLGTSWYIPRSKRQSTTRWSVMIHDVDVADWPCIERSSDGTIPERRRRLIFLYIIRLRWQISD